MNRSLNLNLNLNQNRYVIRHHRRIPFHLYIVYPVSHQYSNLYIHQIDRFGTATWTWTWTWTATWTATETATPTDAYTPNQQPPFF
jgi:hypothetical protein